jgi:hypothetical protein
MPYQLGELPTKLGGDDRTRTRYLLLAKQPLSQLSYIPINLAGPERIELPLAGP